VFGGCAEQFGQRAQDFGGGVVPDRVLHAVAVALLADQAGCPELREVVVHRGLGQAQLCDQLGGVGGAGAQDLQQGEPTWI